MKIEWQATGGEFVTLGDDTATPRNTIEITAWDGEAQVQQTSRFRAAHPFRASRDNVAGQFGFNATQSHATLDAAVEEFYNARARIGEEGTLKITTTAKVITYTNAILKSVRRGAKEGVRLEIQYSLLIFEGTIE